MVGVFTPTSAVVIFFCKVFVNLKEEKRRYKKIRIVFGEGHVIFDFLDILLIFFWFSWFFLDYFLNFFDFSDKVWFFQVIYLSVFDILRWWRPPYSTLHNVLVARRIGSNDTYHSIICDNIFEFERRKYHPDNTNEKIQCHKTKHQNVKPFVPQSCRVLFCEKKILLSYSITVKVKKYSKTYEWHLKKIKQL